MALAQVASDDTHLDADRSIFRKLRLAFGNALQTLLARLTAAMSRVRIHGPMPVLYRPSPLSG